jgi:hypothetical protein
MILSDLNSNFKDLSFSLRDKPVITIDWKMMKKYEGVQRCNLEDFPGPI